MEKNYVLTFDVDWAPDCAILECLELVESAGFKATFFTTHSTPLNHQIIERGHNLGIHPNFLPGSTQGENVEAIISECLSYAPHAWSMRTHALVQSSPLLFEVFSKFPQLTLDVSLFMHRSRHAHKGEWELDGIYFERILYNWEDDAEFSAFIENAIPELFFGELTIFDFHPIHILLNSTNGTEYRKLKSHQPHTPLNLLDPDIFKQYANHGIGTRTYLEEILNSQHRCIDLSEV